MLVELALLLREASLKSFLLSQLQSELRFVGCNWSRKFRNMNQWNQRHVFLCAGLICQMPNCAPEPSSVTDNTRLNNMGSRLIWLSSALLRGSRSARDTGGDESMLVVMYCRWRDASVILGRRCMKIYIPRIRSVVEKFAGVWED